MKRFRDRIICICMAMATVLAFVISNDTYILPDEMQGIHMLEKILWQIEQSTNSFSISYLLIAVLLYIAYRNLFRKFDRALNKWAIPFSIVSSFIVLLCESYFKYDTWQMVFGSHSAFVLSLVRGSGIAVLFYCAFQIINRISFCCERTADIHTVRYVVIVTLIIMICWIPYFVIMFPGSICPDASDEIAQITGNPDYCWTIKTIIPKTDAHIWNNHHPVFYTFILSVFVKLGAWIGSYSIGFEIYAISQCCILAITLSYLLLFLSQRGGGVPRTIQIFLLACFALDPLVPLWGMTLTKDIPFTIALVFCIIFLYKWLDSPDEFKISDKCKLIISFMLLLMLRNNGFYMLLIIVPFTVFYFWRKDRTQIIKSLIILAVPLLVFKIGYEGILFSALDISKGSVREMLAIPFQQTARLAKDYGEDITEEEQDAILSVLSFEDIAELGESYNPTHADRVKNKYNKYASSDDLKNYFSAWKQGLLEHPGVYIEAFLDVNYSWFDYSSKQDFPFYNGVIEKCAMMLEGVESPEALSSARRGVSYIVTCLANIPFTSWLIEFSFYTWGYLVLFIVMLIRKKYKELIASGMIYINYLICFIGPVAYTRYAIPMMICFPLVAVWTFWRKEDGNRMRSA